MATMYRWRSVKFFPGWIIRVVWWASLAVESSSAQISWRLPVLASMTTIGAPGLNALDMSVKRTALVLLNALGLSRPGTRTTIMLPGLKPSLRLYSATWTWLPWVFEGIPPCGRFTRTPVLLEASCLVNRSLGKGNREGLLANGWQSEAGAAAADADAARPATAKTKEMAHALCRQGALEGSLSMEIVVARLAPLLTEPSPPPRPCPLA